MADFSTLSVYTYTERLICRAIPAMPADGKPDVPPAHATLPNVLAAIFGPRTNHSVFSITSSQHGDFLVMDESLHVSFAGFHAAQVGYTAIYLHESSTERSGAEVSGALSTLCDCLARARVPVLNVCTLARNIMLVPSRKHADALATLRTAVEQPATPSKEAAASSSGPERPVKRQHVAPSTDGVRIEVTSAKVAVASLSVAALKRCSHAILSLFFLTPAVVTKNATATAGLRERPTLQHLFELGGEVSMIVEEDSLDRLEQTERESSDALFKEIKDTIVHNWRVLDITAADGCDGIGILSSVCLPFASLPLLNVSTLDHTFVLVHHEHLGTAIDKLTEVGFGVSAEDH